MRYHIGRPSRAARRARTLILVAAGLTLGASACDRPEPLPTSPGIAALAAGQSTVVGASVTSLGNFESAAINETGQLAGYLNGHAALWSGGHVLDLGTLGGTHSYANAINNAGQVAGHSYTAADPEGGWSEGHAFLWTPGAGMQDLGTLGGPSSIAHGMNDHGQVVGESYTSSGARHAFLWTPGQGMQDLGALGGDFTSAIAHDINNSGQVVGESSKPGPPESASRAFLWTSARGMEPIGSLAGLGSIALAINDAGQVVGRSWTGYGWFHAFLWTSRTGMQDLGTLVTSEKSGMNSMANAINEDGLVVGVSNAAGNILNHAFVWSASDGMEDLYPSTGQSWATGINNRGQVIFLDLIATLQFAADNRPPSATVGGPYVGTEGLAVALAFAASDADGDALTYTWDLGDGTTGSGLTPPSRHVYADNGSYDISLTASDNKGGTDTRTTTAVIANVAPSIPAGGLTAPSAPLDVGAGGVAAPVTLAFTDPAGPQDTYAAQIQCGNGATLSPNGITSPYAGACTYTSAGIYVVRATVSDEDGGTSPPAFFQYVVVYDPTAGSTTGSGFYDVPAHAGVKAHFSFDAEFRPAQSAAPNGRAKFWVPDGGIDFESTTVEMLVLTGNRAQFWGAGTLNGADARFRITVVDGALAGHAEGDDGFRIELWQGETLVLDTQPGAAQDAPVTTAIGGGNIRIRR